MLAREGDPKHGRGDLGAVALTAPGTIQLRHRRDHLGLRARRALKHLGLILPRAIARHAEVVSVAGAGDQIALIGASAGGMVQFARLSPQHDG